MLGSKAPLSNKTLTEPVERGPVQTRTVFLTVPWHLRDLSEWRDQNCRVHVDAWMEHGDLEWRIAMICPADDDGFEEWGEGSSSAAQKLFYRHRETIGNDPGFETAVSDAAHEAGITEGEAA
ncbi:hypothetical protein [Amorphus sp. MBR-141]